jgi:hypothetical protein
VKAGSGHRGHHLAQLLLRGAHSYDPTCSDRSPS